MRRRRRCRRFTAVVAALAALSLSCGIFDGSDSENLSVALILKNTTNPYFVSMAESARAEADRLDISLTVSAGQRDGDAASQITAIESAIGQGDTGIVITPVGDDVARSLERARSEGLFVVVLDTPLGRPDAVDVTFATDNFLAGQLIGRWTAETLDGEHAVIAMLDLFDDRVTSVDYLRDQGFLQGMGIIDGLLGTANGNEPRSGAYSGGTYEVVCHEPTHGSAEGGHAAMAACLSENRRINVVYTANEPAAQGASDALIAAGAAEGVLMVSVDGGCDPGLRLVDEGVIGATALQYPDRMAVMGIRAIKEFAQNSPVPAPDSALGFVNVGVALVTDAPVDRLESLTASEGTAVCWG